MLSSLTLPVLYCPLAGLEPRSERDIAQSSFIRGADLEAESDALVQPVLDAAAGAGAIVPRIEIVVAQDRGVVLRSIASPDLAHVAEDDDVQPFRILVVHRPDGLADLARIEDGVVAAEAEVCEPATGAAPSEERLFIERNLAATFWV